MHSASFRQRCTVAIFYCHALGFYTYFNYALYFHTISFYGRTNETMMVEIVAIKLQSPHNHLP